MKNFLILVFTLIATATLCSAQTINDYIQSVDLIDMGNYEIPFSSDFCYFDGAIYYVTFDEEDEDKQRYSLVKKTPTSTETTEFYLNFHLIVNRGFWTITVDSNLVVLEDQFVTYYFQRTPEGLKNILFTNLSVSTKQLKIFGNSIFRSHCDIQGSALWGKTQTWVEVFDLQKKTRRKYEFPNPLGIEYMYFTPRNLIEITKENVYVMDVLDYKIKIYNYEGNLIDSIYKPFMDNKIVPTPINDQSKEELYKFDVMTQRVRRHSKTFEENWKNAKLMSRINLLNDSTLLICYTEPNGDFATNVFDVWKLDTKKKKWVILKEGLKIEQYVNSEREGKFDIKRFPVFHNYSAFYNNVLVTQNNYSYDILKLKTYTTCKEFHSLNEDYLKKSEIPNTIFVYKFQFN